MSAQHNSTKALQAEGPCSPDWTLDGGMKIPVVANIIDDVAHDSSWCSGVLPIAEYKACVACGTKFSLSEFPKKGNGRYESRCKGCHNERQRNRRGESIAPDWSVNDLPVVERENATAGDFVNVLYSSLATLGYLRTNSEISVDSLLKRPSRVDSLLEGKLNAKSRNLQPRKHR